MKYLPIFLDLEGRHCLLVGGGEAAAAKAELLWRAGAEVRVVAAALGTRLHRAVHCGKAAHIGATFAPGQLDGVALVIAADERPGVNEAVACAAQLRSLPVNVVDEPALCSFIMPAIVDRSPVMVAIGTGGCAPWLARLLRLWLEHAFPERLGDLAALAGRFRPVVRSRLPEPDARRRLWQRVVTGDVAALVLSGDETAAGGALLRLIEAVARRDGEAA